MSEPDISPSERLRLEGEALTAEMYKEFEEDEKKAVIKTISKDMKGLDLETLKDFKQTIENAKESNNSPEVEEPHSIAQRSADNSIKPNNNLGRY